MKFRCLLLVPLLGILGCGSGPVFVPVDGEVIYQGKPLTSGTVMFQPQFGQPAQGSIRPDGSFELETFGQGQGVVAGRHKVRITSYATDESAEATAPSAEIALGKMQIPDRYGRFSTSGLEVTVDASENQHFVFRLED